MAPSQSKLKWSLSSVPATALNASSRKILDRLNQYMPLPSPKRHSRDSRGLAELMGFQWHEAKPLEGSAAKILEAWETRPGSTLDKLIGYLEDMDRHDVIQDLIPTLEIDVEKYKESLVKASKAKDAAKHQETPVQVDKANDVSEHQETPVQVDEDSTELRNQVLTRDDLRDGVFTQYDALLVYDDDDIDEAFEIAQNLESPKVGFKLLIRARDVLGGSFEFETDLELMMNRCRHIVMLLTPNFVRNPTLKFHVNFVVKLGIVRSKRILIPVIVKPCGIPQILKDMTPINLTKTYSQIWLWENLVNSILPKGRAPFSLPPHEGCPLNIMKTIPVPSASEDIG